MCRGKVAGGAEPGQGGPRQGHKGHVSDFRGSLHGRGLRRRASAFAATKCNCSRETIGSRGRWAIEIKRSLSARPKKGFHLACQDIEPDQRFLVYPGEGHHPGGADIEITGLKELAYKLASA